MIKNAPIVLFRLKPGLPPVVTRAQKEIESSAWATAPIGLAANPGRDAHGSPVCIWNLPFWQRKVKNKPICSPLRLFSRKTVNIRLISSKRRSISRKTPVTMVETILEVRSFFSGSLLIKAASLRPVKVTSVAFYFQSISPWLMPAVWIAAPCFAAPALMPPLFIAAMEASAFWFDTRFHLGLIILYILPIGSKLREFCPKLSWYCSLVTWLPEILTHLRKDQAECR